MKKNVGVVDGVVRVGGGAGLLTWALLGGPVWAWLGVVPLLTAAVGFCPLYALLGLNTCPLKVGGKGS